MTNPVDERTTLIWQTCFIKINKINLEKQQINHVKKMNAAFQSNLSPWGRSAKTTHSTHSRREERRRTEARETPRTERGEECYAESRREKKKLSKRNQRSTLIGSILRGLKKEKKELSRAASESSSGDDDDDDDNSGIVTETCAKVH